MAATYTPDRPVHSRAKSSSFSFRSQKSDKSGDKMTPLTPTKIRVDMHETKEEKAKTKFRNKTKLNPNQAMVEEQPSSRAHNDAVTLQQLRGTQLKDWQGNVITDPDSSNPARPRMERPLDTIRSFEAAIDDGRRQKAKLLRSESAGDHMFTGSSSRRSSMHGSDFDVNPRSTVSLAPPYQHYQQSGTRRVSHQKSQAYDQYSRDPYARGPPSSYNRGRGGIGMGQRMNTAPAISHRQQYQPDYSNGYSSHTPQAPYHGHFESFDTTADSTGTSEPWTNSTDPSSENSSIDRLHAARMSEGDAYANQGTYDRRSPSKGQFADAIVEEGRHPLSYGGGAPNELTPAYHVEPYVDSPIDYQQPTSAYPYPQREASFGQGAAPPPPPPAHTAPVHSAQSLRNAASIHQQQSGSTPNQSYQHPSHNQQPYQTQGRPNPYHDPNRAALIRKKQGEKQQAENGGDKRKSWLRRTFSRKD